VSIEKLDQLGDMYIDVLRELGNIGSGNAATSLSTLLNTAIDIGIPSVKIVDINEAACLLGGPENIVVGILAKVSGDVDAMVMFIIDEQFARLVLENLLHQTFEGCANLTQLQISALSEVGNIMISSYVNSIAEMASLKMKLTVPAISVDMVGAMLCVPSIEIGEVSDQVIFIEDDILSQEGLTSKILLVPSIESLNKIMHGLGLEVL